MPQSSVVRCAMSAAIMSAVVGGLAYATAEQRCEQQQQKLKEMAQEECLAVDPQQFLSPKATDLAEVSARLHRLNALHEICSFAMAGEHS